MPEPCVTHRRQRQASWVVANPALYEPYVVGNEGHKLGKFYKGRIEQRRSTVKFKFHQAFEAARISAVKERLD